MTRARLLLLSTTLLTMAACMTVTPLPGGRLVSSGDFVGSVGTEFDGFAAGGGDVIGVGLLPNLWAAGRFGVGDGADAGFTLFPFGLELDGRGRLFADDESALALGLGGSIRAGWWGDFQYLSSQANLDLHYERGEVARALVLRAGPSLFLDENGSLAFGGRGAVGLRFGGGGVAIVPSLGLAAYSSGSSNVPALMGGMGVGLEFGRDARRRADGRTEGKQDW